jgi:hypothetical protein
LLIYDLRLNQKKFADLKFLDSHIIEICGFEICGFKKHLHAHLCKFATVVNQPYLRKISRCQLHWWHIAPGINNTSGKFATIVNGTTGVVHLEL